MKVKFLIDKKFSNNGIDIIKGKKDNVYDLTDENMAKSFISLGFAKKLSPILPTKALNPNLENKAIEGTEENKEEKLKEKLKTMKRIDLIEYAKKNYALVLDKNLTNKKLIKKILEQAKEE